MSETLDAMTSDSPEVNTLDIRDILKDVPPRDVPVVCVHHLSRDQQLKLPKYMLDLLAQKGKGDCMACSIDPVNNPYCRGYSPVHVNLVE